MDSQIIQTINPATFEPIAEYEAFSAKKVSGIVEATNSAQQQWASLPLETRIDHLRTIAEKIRNCRVSLADRIVLEMGKPVREALGEVDKCAWAFDYYAENGPTILRDEIIATAAKRSWVSHEPLGIVLGIMPWNFPWWQVARFVAPSLLIGNAVLLKHSSNVTGCAFDIESLMLSAGLPEDVFRALVISDSMVAKTTAELISDPRIAAVTFTGSERAGSAVAALAGAATKKSLLELGGSDPFIILEDANLDTVVAAAVKSRFLNCGQSCLSAKRFIVHEALGASFIEGFAERISQLHVGDPTSEATEIGPLARADLAEALRRQVEQSVAAGARLVTAEHPVNTVGAWYQPSLLSNATVGMPIMAEETFGPVAAVTTVASVDEAVAVANSSRFGLGASVWGVDEDRALSVAQQVNSGAVFVNSVVASDPRLPFGGTKSSGYGRELGSAGALEFANTRTYYMGTQDSAGA